MFNPTLLCIFDLLYYCIFVLLYGFLKICQVVFPPGFHANDYRRDTPHPKGLLQDARREQVQTDRQNAHYRIYLTGKDQGKVQGARMIQGMP
jgi:hypothetical protein